jgi:hypothetical protein
MTIETFKEAVSIQQISTEIRLLIQEVEEKSAFNREWLNRLCTELGSDLAKELEEVWRKDAMDLLQARLAKYEERMRQL